MVHLVMYVMETEGVSIALLTHELENNDVSHWESHLVQEMT